MHFHAKWRTADMKTRPFRDWTYCDLKGKGVFVGDMLSLMNPVAAWWGEGDEKIFVDGETFPSWFGTGSEDYYGYAWSNPEPFQHPYHNQTRCDGTGTGGNLGRTSVNRFHILDDIPFEKSFRFDMEFWHWTPNVTVTTPRRATGTPGPARRTTSSRTRRCCKTSRPRRRRRQPFRIKGALEGEKLKSRSKSSDFALGPARHDRPSATATGAAKPSVGPAVEGGEWADLGAARDGRRQYHVVVYLTKARDYGIVQFAWTASRWASRSTASSR